MILYREHTRPSKALFPVLAMVVLQKHGMLESMPAALFPDLISYDSCMNCYYCCFDIATTLLLRGNNQTLIHTSGTNEFDDREAFKKDGWRIHAPHAKADRHF